MVGYEDWIGGTSYLFECSKSVPAFLAVPPKDRSLLRIAFEQIPEGLWDHSIDPSILLREICRSCELLDWTEPVECSLLCTDIPMRPSTSSGSQ